MHDDIPKPENFNAAHFQAMVGRETIIDQLAAELRPYWSTRELTALNALISELADGRPLSDLPVELQLFYTRVALVGFLEVYTRIIPPNGGGSSDVL